MESNETYHPWSWENWKNNYVACIKRYPSGITGIVFFLFFLKKRKEKKNKWHA